MFFFNKQKLSGRVSILIAVRGDSRYTLELCVKSIIKNTDYPDYQFIICNDNVDEETSKYLAVLEKTVDARIVKCTNPGIPKDDLARAVDTEYFIFMHDDIKIKSKDWLSNRLRVMAKNPRNAIVGTVVKNFGSDKVKRFFPLGLLVKTEVAKKFNLRWGKLPDKGLDTGGPAYQQFFEQKEYRFVPYKISKDVFHFGSMTWVTCKDENFPGINKLLKEREERVKLIKYWLDNNKY